MKHTILIWSTNQTGFTRIERRVEISQDQLEEYALRDFKESDYTDEGKSYFAELDSTIHD